jgi:hypothetical protein
MSYCEDYIDPFDREPDDDDWYDEDDDDSWDCAYPGECLMGYTDHMRHECYTVEDAEEMDGGV